MYSYIIDEGTTNLICKKYNAYNTTYISDLHVASITTEIIQVYICNNTLIPIITVLLRESHSHSYTITHIEPIITKINDNIIQSN